MDSWFKPRMILIAHIVLLSAALVGASKICPNLCLCYDYSDLVDCRGHGFTHVPRNLPHGTWLLDLGGNNLSKLQSHSFAGLWSLRILVLSDSQIRMLEPHAFSSLGFLEKLDLSHNSLHRLSPGFSESLSSLRELRLGDNNLESLGFQSLEKLENLEKLDLSNNRIHVVEPGTFRTLSRLRHLNLQGNQLEILQDRTLAMLQSLEVLLLGQNNISTIETDAFTSLHSLSLLGLEENQLIHLKFKTYLSLHTLGTHLQLAGNPWVCNCDLHRVFSKISSVRRLHVDDYKNITCAWPSQLAGHPLAWVDTQLCVAETATVLVITGTVLVTVIGAIVMAERNRKKNHSKSWNEEEGSGEQQEK
ncbi:slit homolog 1 protein-like [Acipenser ruthenus]|uniref:slit homolog 1 protein-like n=1 Tax=Acipenser ruthenus TaxID=7906 RepID=UPI0027422345|nr:slit homolog 1 protein-like [Acipenser ruthenus]